MNVLLLLQVMIMMSTFYLYICSGSGNSIPISEPEMCDIQHIKDYLESCSSEKHVLHYLRNITNFQ